MGWHSMDRLPLRPPVHGLCSTAPCRSLWVKPWATKGSTGNTSGLRPPRTTIPWTSGLHRCLTQWESRSRCTPCLTDSKPTCSLLSTDTSGRNLSSRARAVALSLAKHRQVPQHREVGISKHLLTLLQHHPVEPNSDKLWKMTLIAEGLKCCLLCDLKKITDLFLITSNNHYLTDQIKINRVKQSNQRKLLKKKKLLPM